MRKLEINKTSLVESIARSQPSGIDIQWIIAPVKLNNDNDYNKNDEREHEREGE